MPLSAITILLSLLLAGADSAFAESHTVTFNSSACSNGTVKLMNGTTSLLIEDDKYTADVPLIGAFAYLDNGCATNDDGWGCILAEFNLQNDDSNPAANSIDLSMVSPHAYSGGIAISYTNGEHSGYGASCGDANCLTAFHSSGDTCAQIDTGGDDLNIAVTFCGSDSAYTADSSYSTCTSLSVATSSAESSGSSGTTAASITSSATSTTSA